MAERERVERSEAAHHARCVFDVLEEAAAGTLDNIRAPLPDMLDPLFDSGSQGEMRLNP